MLDPATTSLPAALDGCDGVLLTGGVDVDPRATATADAHPTVEIDADRDAYELALARAALARDLPLLAICRGAQVLNVAAGGTLVQDIPERAPERHRHIGSREPKDAVAHDVTVAPGTLPRAPAGAARSARPAASPSTAGITRRSTPSRRASWSPPTAPDGVVEAIERPARTFCVGVQWHPENFWRTGEFATLFEGLVGAAGADAAPPALITASNATQRARDDEVSTCGVFGNRSNACDRLDAVAVAPRASPRRARASADRTTRTPARGAAGAARQQAPRATGRSAADRRSTVSA